MRRGWRVAPPHSWGGGDPVRIVALLLLAVLAGCQNGEYLPLPHGPWAPLNAGYWTPAPGQLEALPR